MSSVEFILLFGTIVTIAYAKTIITADVSDNESFTYIRPSLADYYDQRERFIKEEDQRFLGATLVLTDEERTVNKYLMELKQNELRQGFNDCYDFIPARHFFEMVDKFNQSKLFQLIKMLPKGAVLHAHDMALGSVDLILKATYRDHLWQKGGFDSKEGPNFIFSIQQPDGEGWQRVSDLRNQQTATVYDEKIRSLFGLYCKDPLNTYKTIDSVWDKFEKMFTSLIPIITFEPVWREYYADALKEFYDDGVLYLEFRGVLPQLYDLDGKIYNPDEVISIYINETERFKSSHNPFIGAKFIFAPIRFANDSVFEGIFELAKNLHLQYPDFVIGFDLVGQEDRGRSLLEFVPQLLNLPDSIHFFFHAGETNWYGMKTDQNLIDAVLLGTKRIGHGFALLKHPNLLKELKRRNICVEINPVSNQVLKLVTDYRNHPATFFFSDNYPVVVSSDDPSFWGASPLSHDFYLAFLGIASAHHDLRLIKQLALNSIEFSAMEKAEKAIARVKFTHSWEKAIKDLALRINTNSSLPI
ncbi:adenosine deaminase AGSA-like [Uranotaenia lowii]|uniref:adenosine deaminase AGSA-like n=1 Tax=Uranotaenia lowii TaxID=190385 RepID=UPI00247A4B2B|nr:adenosine deaminase AGSA-like [Uranotaenia lowii]XP_055606541.1 adenosine deaminase AGSA-like [Uranotaenia lowii]XP_055606542.1 adenosine deaminase AGSA-like [Uranotaenia lowii]XP_055606543.1 adenosine deaminase AGSA-like [Uranotaenia lowii]